MTEFHVEVVRLGPIEKHPSADTLGITQVLGGYPCIVKQGEPGSLREGDLAVYCPVDSIVPTTHPAFAFLQDSKGSPTARIKAKRLRGVFSMGLLIPAKEAALSNSENVELQEGLDVQAYLGIEKYEPDESNRRGGPSGPAGAGGEAERDPGYMPKYTDIEGLRRWHRVLEEGEEVILTEKLHGQNARYLYQEGRLWVGSRTQIKRAPHTATEQEHVAYASAMKWWERKRRFLSFFRLGTLIKAPPKAPRDVTASNWWRVAQQEDFEPRLRGLEGIAVYGEVFGPVQDLKYGSPDTLQFRAFDAFDTHLGAWLDYDRFTDLMHTHGIPMVPVLYRGPWNDACRALAEGKSTLPGADHVREGVVIRPVKERCHPRLGRVILKLIGEGYLLRKSA